MTSVGTVATVTKKVSEAEAATGFLGGMASHAKTVLNYGKDTFISPLAAETALETKAFKGFFGLGIGFTSFMDMMRHIRRFRNSQRGGFEYDPALYSLGFAALDGVTAATSLGYFAGWGLESVCKGPMIKGLAAAMKFIPAKFPIVPVALFGLKQIIDVARDVSQGTATYLEPFTTFGGFASSKLHNYDLMHGGTSPLLPVWNKGFEWSEQMFGIKAPTRSMNRDALYNIDNSTNNYLVDKGVRKAQGIQSAGQKLDLVL